MRFKMLRNVIEIILKKWCFFFTFWIYIGRFTINFLFGIGSKADEQGISIDMYEDVGKAVSPVWMHWLVRGTEVNHRNETMTEKKWNWG